MRRKGPDPEAQAKEADEASRELPDQIARVRATVDTARAQLASVALRPAMPEPDET